MKKITKNVISRKLKEFEQSDLETIFVICNSLEYSDSSQLQGWEFQILRNNYLIFSEIFLKKITKNIIARKLQGFEQSYLEARFAILDSTLTVPNYSVGNFRIKKKFKFSEKIFEKITKTVISRKVQRIEQSYLEARFAIFKITLKGPNYRVGNFKFCKKI